MAYTPTTWVNNSTPAINATNLNHMETGIDEAHDCANILYTPFGDIIATNVQAAITELENEKISKATLDANSIVKADTDDTPIVLAVAEQTLVGRITAGSIDDLSTTQVRTLINVEDGSQETSTAHVNTAGAVMETDYNAHTILVATVDDTPIALGVGASELIGRTAIGNIDSMTMVEARTILNVEDGSTDDQTGAEIKTLYEAESNAYTDTKDTKLNDIELLADVTDATNVAAAGAVMDGDFTAADEIMAGTGAGTHSQITLAASEFLAKKAAGTATNVSATDARTILNVEDAADVTDAVNIASSITGVAAKTTPVDADEVGLIDSAAANVLKKLTWTNIKATLKTYFDTLYIGNVSEDATPQLGGDLDLVNYEILADTTPGTDHTGSGLKGVFTNGNAGSVAFGDVCYMALDGHLEFVDADASTSMPGLYMALGTIAAAASGEWMIMGVARDDTWNWTIGPGISGLIYASVTATTGNTLSQTAPSATGDQVQIVGTALSADVMMFNPSPVLVEIA